MAMWDDLSRRSRGAAKVERVNGAIDEEARRLTDGSPAAGFRGRVLARIEAVETPRRSWRAAFVLSPIAAAAAIVIAVMWLGRPAGPALQVPQTPPIVAAGPTDPAGPKGPALQNATAANTAADRAVRRASPSGTAEGPKGSAPQNGLDPNDVASIAVAPLVIDTLTPESIQIPRLDAVAPIGVAPLDITDQRREP
jgi:hypothetical protein